MEENVEDSSYAKEKEEIRKEKGIQRKMEDKKQLNPGNERQPKV